MKCGVVDCIKSTNSGSLYCERHQKHLVKTPYGKFTLEALEKMDLGTLSKMVAKATNKTEEEVEAKIHKQARRDEHSVDDESI